MSTSSRSRPWGVPAIGTITAHVVVVAGAIVMAAPFVWMLLTSISEESRVFVYPPRFWPDPITFANYGQLFRDAPVARYLWNSTIVGVLSTAGLVLSCAMAAFAFARLEFPGRRLWFALILSTLFVPVQVLLIPRYYAFRVIGWLDTLLPLIVPYCFGGAFGIFLLHQFFRGIPQELVDAARIDGASPGQIFLRVMLPLSGPALASLAIFQFLFSWNDLLQPLIYLNTERSFTFPLALTRFKNHVGGQYMWTVILAGAVIGTIPPILVYIVGQRQFVQGIMLGGVKG
jgi:multiple sugar transport system permease protein